MKIIFKTPLNRPYEYVRDRFDRDLFLHISPQWASFNLERFDGCKQGDEVHILIKILGLKQKWVSLITAAGEDSLGWSFVDEGKVLPWPLTYWKHHHRVDKITDSSCEIVDDIEFKASPAFLGPIIKPILWSSFAIRPKLYRDYFKD
jgi:ligand-binding SRPBCC domain-containing protein